MLKEQHLVGLFFTVTGSGKLASTRGCQSLDVRKTTNVQDLFAVSMFPTRQGNAFVGLCLHFFWKRVCVCVHDCLDFSLRLGKENIIDSLSIVHFHLMILDLWADYYASNFVWAASSSSVLSTPRRFLRCLVFSWSFRPSERCSQRRLNTQCTDLFLNKNMCSCRMWARILSAISCQLHS